MMWHNYKIEYKYRANSKPYWEFTIPLKGILEQGGIIPGSLKIFDGHEILVGIDNGDGEILMKDGENLKIDYTIGEIK
jgi:hypothetical protein